MKARVVAAALLFVVLVANFSGNATGDTQGSARETPHPSSMEDMDTAAVILVSARIDSNGRADPSTERSCEPEDLFEDAIRLVAATEFSTIALRSNADTESVMIPVVFRSGTDGGVKKLIPSVGEPEDWMHSTSFLPPNPVYRKPPDYPDQARIQKIEGEAYIEVLVDESGRVSKAKVVKGTEKLLSKAALEAAKQWRFEPASYRGRPMCLRIVIPFEFSLH